MIDGQLFILDKDYCPIVRDLQAQSQPETQTAAQSRRPKPQTVARFVSRQFLQIEYLLTN